MAPSNKAALKAAKAALDAQKYDEAIVQAQAVLASDPQNYFAKLFLGRALDKRGQRDDAAEAYGSATKIKPNDDQAWLGLRALYEDQGSAKVDEYMSVAVRLAELYVENDNKHRCQSVVDKLVSFVKSQGTRAQYKRALETQLPPSLVYSFLEGRLPHPSYTYLTLAELTEAEEKERINKEIGERRTRLGARIGQVTIEVTREVYCTSHLEELYQNIINWTADDDIRRNYEEKLLQRAYDALLVLPADKKALKRDQVLSMAHGMVIINHPFKLAWNIELEWKDAESLQEWDINAIKEYIGFFPDTGLTKVLKGYISSEISQFMATPNPSTEEGAEENEGVEPELGVDDRLLLMTEGLDDAKDSILAHRMIGDYYIFIEEYESAVETLRKAFSILTTESLKSGFKFQNNQDALNSALATALIHYQAPRNHPEAKSIFHAILQRKPAFTTALIGVGLIFEEEEEYPSAIDFLTRALSKDPTAVRIGAEVAWCKALNGDLEIGLVELEKRLNGMDTSDARSRELRAQTLYRIGKCLWDLDPTTASRKDRTRAYSKFLAAIRANVNFAPAYTSLGIFYEDYARDKRRARQCFQKAFELSPSEVEAAERLARAFANQGDWDIVELIAQRLVDSSQVRPSPGSKKKRGVSWPYSALGVVQMNRQEYSKSITSFLSALRISPDDYHSYVGLGESYHNSGRYNSAARAFEYTENPPDGVQAKRVDDSWFTKYMLANVNRELGEYEKATNGYRLVLDQRPKEFGVSIALLQTLIEQAWGCIETGFLGKAADCALEAFDIATQIAGYRSDAFNLWKAVADACAIYSWVQIRLKDLPFEQVQNILGADLDIDAFQIFTEVDDIGKEEFEQLTIDGETSHSLLYRCLIASILAHKRAIYASSRDIHAQAVAWYNLGWAEFRVHACVEQVTESSKKPLKFIKAAMRCFKRAIELEAGNSEFWNALGVVTTQLNPQVAQHSLVRSLHLNERNARVWTNLGALYLLQNDLELAHQAFSRAQSTDPEYSHAWIGEGIIALLWGDAREALAHFTHSFEISDSVSLITKRQYASSMFDHLVSSPSSSHIAQLIQPLFALQQLSLQRPTDISSRHLAALYMERAGKYDAAIVALESLCNEAEEEYEANESPDALARFCRSKSDLARNRLAADDYSGAAEDASTALDLSEEIGGMDADSKSKIRLSARLTAGLSHYYLRDMDSAIEDFRTALEETCSEADVVCLLGEVLWAKGGEDERNVAREQLFDCVERVPNHTNAIILLGVMAALDGDIDTMAAVREDLERMRTKLELDATELCRIGKVLDSIAALSEGTDGESVNVAMTREITTSITLFPGQPHGWSQLAATSREHYPAEMALRTAMRTVPPAGPLDAGDLARMYAGTGKAGDAQKAIALAPWINDGWISFSEVVA